MTDAARRPPSRSPECRPTVGAVANRCHLIFPLTSRVISTGGKSYSPASIGLADTKYSVSRSFERYTTPGCPSSDFQIAEALIPAVPGSVPTRLVNVISVA